MNIYEKRIAPLFAETGKNDKELETIIGLPKGIIYNWKSGRSKNFEAYIPKIAKHFKVSADYLMGIDPSEPPVKAEGIKEAHDPKTVGEDSKVSKAINFVRCASPDEITEIENFFAYLESKRKNNEAKS